MYKHIHIYYVLYIDISYMMHNIRIYTYIYIHYKRFKVPGQNSPSLISKVPLVVTGAASVEV